MVESALKLQTSSPMNNNQSRINLLKEVKSAVNTASFAPTSDRIEDAKKAVASLMSYVESLEAPKPKRRRKTKQKSGKATSATKVADRQERQFHGRADSPITPCDTKRTASVEEARKSAQEVSDKSGATARAKRKADAIAKANAKEAVASPDVTPRKKPSKKAKVWDSKGQPNKAEIDKRFAELDAKLDAMLALQAMNHDITRSAEVLFSDLPFDPTSTL